MPRKRAGREIADLLRKECGRRWPGAVIPPAEGGRFFREMSDRCGLRERAISDLARKLELWPWKPDDVVRLTHHGDTETRRVN